MESLYERGQKLGLQLRARIEEAGLRVTKVETVQPDGVNAAVVTLHAEQEPCDRPACVTCDVITPIAEDGDWPKAVVVRFQSHRALSDQVPIRAAAVTPPIPVDNLTSFLQTKVKQEHEVWQRAADHLEANKDVITKFHGMLNDIMKMGVEQLSYANVTPVES